MTNFSKKIGTLLLLLSFALFAQTQTTSINILSQELQTLQKQLVPDKRVAILEVTLQDTLQSTIVVKGETDLSDAKAQIIQLLNDKNVSFIDSIKLLPNSSLGDKTWALATLSVSNIRLKPDESSEMVSQALMGTPMKVLDIKNSWYRVQTPENYIGWMDGGGLQRMNETEMNLWKITKRSIFKHTYGNVLNAPNKNGEVISDLVLGDLFEVDSVVHNYLKIKIPDGRTGYVRSDDCLAFDDWCNINPNSQNILLIAKQMMGIPYLWGGLSSKAVDCSGLVKLSFYSQAIILARDASQQAHCGETIDISKIDNLQPGDLLFFGPSNQQIKHVGIYIANGDFIHSSGKVHISSIIPTDPKFASKRHLVGASRVINATDNKGIINVGNHPWYSRQVNELTSKQVDE